MSETKTPLVIAVNETNTNLTITANGKELFVLDSISTGELIRVLSSMKASLLPRVQPETPGPDKPILISPTSRLYIEPVKEHPGNIIVAMFHPGPGWIGINLDRAAASHFRDLIEYSAKLISTH